MKQRDDVDAQFLERDQCILVERRHLQLLGRQPDLGQFVTHQNVHDAAIDPELLAAKGGADQRHVLGRPAVKPGQDDSDHDERKQSDTRVAHCRGLHRYPDLLGQWPARRQTSLTSLGRSELIGQRQSD